jgi:hypothetical protein
LGLSPYKIVMAEDNPMATDLIVPAGIRTGLRARKESSGRRPGSKGNRFVVTSRQGLFLLTRRGRASAAIGRAVFRDAIAVFHTAILGLAPDEIVVAKNDPVAPNLIVAAGVRTRLSARKESGGRRPRSKSNRLVVPSGDGLWLLTRGWRALTPSRGIGSDAVAVTAILCLAPDKVVVAEHNPPFTVIVLAAVVGFSAGEVSTGRESNNRLVIASRHSLRLRFGRIGTAQCLRDIARGRRASLTPSRRIGSDAIAIAAILSLSPYMIVVAEHNPPATVVVLSAVVGTRFSAGEASTGGKSNGLVASRQGGLRLCLRLRFCGTVLQCLGDLTRGRRACPAVG